MSSFVMHLKCELCQFSHAVCRNVINPTFGINSLKQITEEMGISVLCHVTGSYFDYKTEGESVFKALSSATSSL